MMIRRIFSDILLTVGILVFLLSGLCTCAMLTGNGIDQFHPSTWNEALGANGAPTLVGFGVAVLGWLMRRK